MTEMTKRWIFDDLPSSHNIEKIPKKNAFKRLLKIALNVQPKKLRHNKSKK